MKSNIHRMLEYKADTEIIHSFFNTYPTPITYQALL